MQGIYKITNKLDNKVYIGQASNLNERISDHKQKRFVPIDMWINMIGVENFDFEILEECTSDNIDEKEQYYIKEYDSRNPQCGYNKQEGGFNNSIGEGNGRAKMTYEDVIIIRTAYANHQSAKETYQQFQDKITLSQFQSIWQGRSWANVMPEVLTEENKKYYSIEQCKDTAALNKDEILKYRKYYVDHPANEVYDLMISERGDILKYSTFKKILCGNVRPNSIYNDVPVYKKSTKRWELNGEPVSTISESGE